MLSLVEIAGRSVRRCARPSCVTACLRVAPMAWQEAQDGAAEIFDARPPHLLVGVLLAAIGGPQNAVLGFVIDLDLGWSGPKWHLPRVPARACAAEIIAA